MDNLFLVLLQVKVDLNGFDACYWLEVCCLLMMTSISFVMRLESVVADVKFRYSWLFIPESCLQEDY